MGELYTHFFSGLRLGYYQIILNITEINLKTDRIDYTTNRRQEDT